jgi:hypothetical protein
MLSQECANWFLELLDVGATLNMLDPVLAGISKMWRKPRRNQVRANVVHL